MRYKFLFFSLLFIYGISYGLSLEEAIELAKENNPQIRQYIHSIKSREYQLKASKGNFSPSLNYNFNYTKYNDNPTDYFNRNHTLRLEWTVYNQWNNIYQYRASKLNLLMEKENYKKALLDVIYQVKTAYINAVTNLHIRNIRKAQLKLAEINVKVARERFNLGYVTRADLYSTKVRYLQARYNYIKAKTDYKTALAELNSLIGLPLDRDEKLDTKILVRLSEYNIPKYETLKAILYRKKPELKLSKYQIKLAEETIKKDKLSYTPSLSVFLADTNDYSSLYGKSDYNYYGMSLSWNLFSGLKRLNNMLSSKEQKKVQEENYKDIKRISELNLYKKYLQLKQSLENLKVARAILKQAKLNYNQIFNEYKYGKNDIVALVNAETNLANAQETVIKSLQEISLLRIEIEREIGVLDLDEINY